MMTNRRKRYKIFLLLILSGVLVVSTLQLYINTIHAEINWQILGQVRNMPILWKRSPTTTASATIQTVRKLHVQCTERRSNSEHVISINTNLSNLKTTEDLGIGLSRGGRYKPSSCVARRRVAVIISYRDRETHLKIFLNHMHPFLQRQQLDYGIYVIESIPDIKFNRGLLLNAGFIEASKLYEYDCFIFHDVDLLPENDGIKYNCDQSPIHMTSAIDVNNYKLPYSTSFGGACAISKEHFKTVNGYSNLYFGWGGEDDDIEARIRSSRLKRNRLPSNIGRYTTQKHKKANETSDKFRLFKTMRARYRNDGLNSIKYHVLKQEYKRLYTWFLVSINETEILESESVRKQALNKA